MKQKFIFLVFALILPSAVAFNCDGLSGGDLYVCKSIQDANLTSIEKDLLISDIFNKNKITPNFDFIYLWNTNLNFTNSPDGKEYSSGTISNAWIKIISLMPSILDNETLYSSNNEKLLTAYNYRYTLPSGNAKGDCKTEYSLESKDEDLKIYLNNNLIGKDKLISFIISNESDNLVFKSELNIQVNYRVAHYRKKYNEDLYKYE
ncbi:MAG: hypothetical protein Q8N88_04430, partial [Nanoarchaeota archaeon]|nr:hypothetical protein [Nanoarchaeota archaeon]